jgi:hypothetical protein
VRSVRGDVRDVRGVKSVRDVRGVRGRREELFSFQSLVGWKVCLHWIAGCPW